MRYDLQYSSSKSMNTKIVGVPFSSFKWPQIQTCVFRQATNQDLCLQTVYFERQYDIELFIHVHIPLQQTFGGQYTATAFHLLNDVPLKRVVVRVYFLHTSQDMGISLKICGRLNSQKWSFLVFHLLIFHL